MVLNVSISAEAETALKAKAAAAGIDLETFAARFLERLAAPSKSLKDISGPIGESFSHSGMSEEELSEFLEVEKHAMCTKQADAWKSFVTGVTEWADSHLLPGYIADDSRDAAYGDRS